MIKSNFRYYIALVLFLLCSSLYAQKILSVHKASKQETIFGISKQYGVTIDELKNANPAMREDGFMLQAGMHINIPEHNETAFPTHKAPHVILGVMLPLHNLNGDGKRMMEYYRGVLLAINDLKREGISVTVNAWNLAEGDDARTTLIDGRAEKCDVIFGPLYTAQVPYLANYCAKNNIRLVIPFSINGDDVQRCPQVYQIYQSPSDVNETAINQFVALFGNYHPVFIDCNDVNSTKGNFTFGLRKILDEKKIHYSITNLINSQEQFAKAFSTAKRNVVILNTGRSPELGQVFKKLDEMLSDKTRRYEISMFGYNEWFMYAKVYGSKFRQYDTYIPSVYNYDEESDRVRKFEKAYTAYYNTWPMQSLPNFAITGYDQTMFFVRGILKYGNQFHGLSSQQSYTAIQSPYLFERVGNGGYKNSTFMLVHYK